MRDSIVFYRSFYEAIKDLPDAELAKSFRAIMEYGLDEIEPSGTGIERTIFLLTRPQIDANNKRYRNGKQGGRPTKKSKEDIDNGSDLGAKYHVNVDRKPSDNLKTDPDNLDKTICKPNVNVNVNENDKKENTLKGVKEKRFTPPTLENVMGYCQEKGLQVDAERFIDFYSSKGWMVGKNKMKDWKAAVRNWSRQDRGQEIVRPKKNGFQNFEERETDYDAMVQDMVNDLIGGMDSGEI